MHRSFDGIRQNKGVSAAKSHVDVKSQPGGEHMLGIGTLAKKVFGTANDRKIKATRPIVEKINSTVESSELSE